MNVIEDIYLKPPPEHKCRCGKEPTHFHYYGGIWDPKVKRKRYGQWILECDGCCPPVIDTEG